MRSAGRSSSGRGAAQVRGGLVDPELEAAGELDGPQHAQAVVAECPRVDGPQDAALEVRAAADRVDVFAGQRVPPDGIDREVAAAKRFLLGQERVAPHLESAVTGRHLGLAPGQRHVDVADLVDGEALADGLDRTHAGEQRAERGGRQAVDLEIDVLRLPPEQAIADPATDDKRPAALAAHGGGDRAHALDEIRTAGCVRRCRGPVHAFALRALQFNRSTRNLVVGWKAGPYTRRLSCVQSACRGLPRRSASC